MKVLVELADVIPKQVMTTENPEQESNDPIVSLIKQKCLFAANFEGINPQSGNSAV